MEQLLGNRFLNVLLKDLERAKSLTIISPYINSFAVEKIQSVLIKNKEAKTLQFITLPMGYEYVSGAIQPDALLSLKEMGFELRSLKNLHAKLYIIDQKIMYVGSANFTYSGFIKNIEEMQKNEPLSIQLDHIQKRFIEPSIPLNIDQQIIESFKKEYSDLIEQYENIVQLIEDQFDSNVYVEFLESLVIKDMIECFEHITTKYGRNVYRINNKYLVKILRSKVHDKTAPFEHNFRYSLSVTSGTEALKNKINAFIFILGDTEQYVCLPRKFLESQFLITRHLDGNRKAWQFQISFGMTRTFLRTKGKSTMKIFNVTEYKNKIRFKEFIEIKVLAKNSKIYKELLEANKPYT